MGTLARNGLIKKSEKSYKHVIPGNNSQLNVKISQALS